MSKLDASPAGLTIAGKPICFDTFESDLSEESFTTVKRGEIFVLCASNFRRIWILLVVFVRDLTEGVSNSFGKSGITACRSGICFSPLALTPISSFRYGCSP